MPPRVPSELLFGSDPNKDALVSTIEPLSILRCARVDLNGLDGSTVASTIESELIDSLRQVRRRQAIRELGQDRRHGVVKRHWRASRCHPGCGSPREAPSERHQILKFGARAPTLGQFRFRFS